MSRNHAVYLQSKNSSRLLVKPSSYPRSPPPDHHLIIKSQALAINPADWLIQSPVHPDFSYLCYPLILGSDLAGIVVSSSSPLFVPGDRVVAHTIGTYRHSYCSVERLVMEHLVAKIPDHVSSEQAAVLPSTFSIAATALFFGSATAEGQPRFISQVSGLKELGEFPGLRLFGLVKPVLGAMWNGIATEIKSKVKKVGYRVIWRSGIGNDKNKEVAKAVWNVYLAQAMAKGEFQVFARP
ncbi:chaperonin 10-like protein [Apiosordaria backusii]|uniref:Chaperonin 10-like protein n=1 Tax=Apiosordaria backusii TaxID=314023 RepID=A0AA40ES64_9PEZI|nr:chaperonin 10-like protein [Apiosordaria backusii]